ncbi:MAG: cupin domain-containing protein [Planctomycetes bacterium]|nr:cupin domain-containing protein [Planctomycetota bacterium]
MIKVMHYTDAPAENVEQGASGVKIRWIITEAMGAKNFVMRHFEIAPGGYTPRHQHAWEHEVFVLAGQGVVATAEGDRPLKQGDVVFVPAQELHQFRNPGQESLSFLCLIPSPSKCNL